MWQRSREHKQWNYMYDDSRLSASPLFGNYVSRLGRSNQPSLLRGIHETAFQTNLPYIARNPRNAPKSTCRELQKGRAHTPSYWAAVASSLTFVGPTCSLHGALLFGFGYYVCSSFLSKHAAAVNENDATNNENQIAGSKLRHEGTTFFHPVRNSSPLQGR